MPLAPKNLLVLMSDEHNPRALGCAGHPLAQTPQLDRLAARGTRFTSAYTTSPICVPARAGFATGKYAHQIGYWDNADAYDGAVPSWHHLLRARGHRVVSIGKLHFRGLPGDDHGFSEELLPMHVVDGIGDLKGLIRRDIPRRNGYDKLAKLAGPGESPYTRYDRDIAARAQAWLREEAPRNRARPWALFVSFVCPHFPLIAPAGTPPQIVTRLNEEIVKAMHLPEVKDRVLKTGAVPAGDRAAEFEAFIAKERQRLGEIISRSGIVLAD